MKDNKKTLIKLISSLAVVFLILLIIYLILKAFGITDISQQEIQDFIESTGVIAPIVYIGVSFAQVTLLPIPGAITILAGTYIFGPWLAFLYSYIGMMLGSLAAFGLGKLVGRPYVNWVAGSHEEAEMWIKKLKGREKVFLFFAFLFPLFPDDILCSIAGILPIKWSTFIFMQLFTRITSILGTIFFMSGEIIPFSGWGLFVIGGFGLLLIIAFIFSMKYSEKINQLFDSFIDKIIRKNKNQQSDCSD